MTTRQSTLGEVFTPPALADELALKLYTTDPTLFTDRTKTFLDPAVGDGELLRAVIRLLYRHQPEFNAMHTFKHQLYGIDIMFDNVCDCIYCLLTEQLVIEGWKRPKGAVISTGMKEHNKTSPTEQIEAFNGTRKYVLEGSEMWFRKYDDHRVKLSTNGGKAWKVVNHIVRADTINEEDVWQSIFEKNQQLHALII